jgi:hypothetical protein
VKVGPEGWHRTMVLNASANADTNNEAKISFFSSNSAVKDLSVDTCVHLLNIGCGIDAILTDNHPLACPLSLDTIVIIWWPVLSYLRMAKHNYHQS